MRCTVVSAQPYEPESNISDNHGNKKEPTLQDIQEHLWVTLQSCKLRVEPPYFFFKHCTNRPYKAACVSVC